MIIRATFRDNDFTRILERFFSNFKFDTYTLYYSQITGEDYESLKEYRRRYVESKDLLEKIVFKQDEITKDDTEKFINIVTECLDIYIKNFYSRDYDYLRKQLEISLVKSCEDGWENGEVVYHFINKGVSITA